MDEILDGLNRTIHGTPILRGAELWFTNYMAGLHGINHITSVFY